VLRVGLPAGITGVGVEVDAPETADVATVGVGGGTTPVTVTRTVAQSLVWSPLTSTASTHAALVQLPGTSRLAE
jgi:hypothetical protein